MPDIYRQYLEARGIEETSVRTRVSAIKTIQNNLERLGARHKNLQSEWRYDNLEYLLSRIQQIIDDYHQGGRDYTILMPESTNPSNRLPNWKNWLRQYRDCLVEELGGRANADRIREHVLAHYISPKRNEGAAQVDVVVGDVNSQLGLPESWRSICSALTGKKFLRLAQLSPPEQIGADDSARTIFRFNLTSSAEVEMSIADHQQVKLPKNLILYGPPGTGKTYATAAEAVRLCDEVADYTNDEKGRVLLMTRYRQLKDEGRIYFLTFHQSFDYESFVEGLRPETGDDASSTGFRLEAQSGIFKDICAMAEQGRNHAQRSVLSPAIDLYQRQFWKLSLGADGTDEDIFDEAIENNFIAVNWGGRENLSDAKFSSRKAIEDNWKSGERDNNQPANWGVLHAFRNEMSLGDIVIISKRNKYFRGIAEVTGNYEFDESAEQMCHRRKVRWLLKLDIPLPVDQIYKSNFMQRAFYKLHKNQVIVPALNRLLSVGDASEQTENANGQIQQFVLIIDEINRANISKVFGELITLLEPDKRLGMPNQLTLTLPYSKEEFGIPCNLHIIATMNTADRSIALLDTAIRRRFEFKEIAPNPDLLGNVGQIDMGKCLEAINDRIEYLIDRDHRIGHAFFIGCKTLQQLNDVMRNKIIPLLQEYFFDDWSRIHIVIGNGFISKRVIKPPRGFDGAPRESWYVRNFFDESAYTSLIELNSGFESNGVVAPINESGPNQ